MSVPIICEKKEKEKRGWWGVGVFLSIEHVDLSWVGEMKAVFWILFLSARLKIKKRELSKMAKVVSILGIQCWAVRVR